MAGRNDRCDTCEHFRDDHAATGCLKPSCTCMGFERRVARYNRAGTKKGGRLKHAGDGLVKGMMKTRPR